MGESTDKVWVVEILGVDGAFCFGNLTDFAVWFDEHGDPDDTRMTVWRVTRDEVRECWPELLGE